MSRALFSGRRGRWPAVIGVSVGLAGAGCSSHGAAPPKADSGPPPENCTDGVDNDGNGLVDCADPACRAGFTCVAAPAGWTLAAFLPSFPSGGGQPPCPDGYVSRPLLVQEPASSVSCSCMCGGPCSIACGTPDDAPPGPLAVTTGTPDGGCADGGTDALPSYGCVPFGLAAGQSIGFDHVPFWQDSTLAISNTVVGHPDALLCTPSSMGGGCGTGRACVPRPSNEWSFCAYQPGRVDGRPLSPSTACSQEWVSSIENDGGTPSAVAVATAWDVSSSCTPCDCTEDPEAACADATLTLYTDPSCQSVATTVGPGACVMVGADIQSARYSATPVHDSCTASQSAPTGIETSVPNGGFIVCCGQ